MSRLHVFADEAGCLTFEKKTNVSRYFILCTILMRDCSVGNALLDLRRRLAWDGAALGEYFHASTDKQQVRDAVFATICEHDFSIQATIMEKSKAQPHIRAEKPRFYQFGWFYHFKFGVSRRIPSNVEALVTAAAIGTRKGNYPVDVAKDGCSVGERDRPATENAARELARCLHGALEKYDPSEDGYGWDELSEFQRETYCLIIRRLLDHDELVRTVLKSSASSDGIVGRDSAQVGKQTDANDKHFPPAGG